MAKNNTNTIIFGILGGCCLLLALVFVLLFGLMTISFYQNVTQSDSCDQSQSDESYYQYYDPYYYPDGYLPDYGSDWYGGDSYYYDQYYQDLYDQLYPDDYFDPSAELGDNYFSPQLT